MADRGDLQDYIDTCRARVESQIVAFREFAAAVSRVGIEDHPGLESMLESLEYDYFNNLVIVLDAYFVDRVGHHLRPPGPIAAEVAGLRRSLIEGEGALLADDDEVEAKGILGLAPGDSIQLTQHSFSRLAGAYFAELERRHSP
jgi:hypothetical protein